jgi:hypothetical protein
MNVKSGFFYESFLANIALIRLLGMFVEIFNVSFQTLLSGVLALAVIIGARKAL